MRGTTAVVLGLVEQHIPRATNPRAPTVSSLEVPALVMRDTAAEVPGSADPHIRRAIRLRAPMVPLVAQPALVTLDIMEAGRG